MSRRPVRWIVHFLWLSAAGLLPALLVYLGASQRPELWPLLEEQASQRARFLDAGSERWLQTARQRASELAALLGQLPPGPPGKAARVTMQAFLERRLEEDRELDGYLLVDGQGRSLLEVVRPGASPLRARLEVAQAAARPTLMLVQGGPTDGDAALLAAAPVLRDGKLDAVVAGRVGTEVLAPLLPARPRSLSVTLVEAGGVRLGPPLPGADLERLGSQGRSGRAQLGRRRLASAPLAHARAALVVATPPRPLLPGWRPAYALALLLALGLAAVAASRLSRGPGDGLKTGRRPGGS